MNSLGRGVCIGGIPSMQGAQSQGLGLEIWLVLCLPLDMDPLKIIFLCQHKGKRSPRPRDGPRGPWPDTLVAAWLNYWNYLPLVSKPGSGHLQTLSGALRKCLILSGLAKASCPPPTGSASRLETLIRFWFAFPWWLLVLSIIFCLLAIIMFSLVKGLFRSSAHFHFWLLIYI